METVVPFLPRIRCTTSCSDSPSIRSSSIRTISSYGCKPAFSAGDPFTGATIMYFPFERVISAPIPIRSPASDSLWAAASSCDRYVEYGSPMTSAIPRSAPSINLSLSTGYTPCFLMTLNASSITGNDALSVPSSFLALPSPAQPSNRRKTTVAKAASMTNNINRLLCIMQCPLLRPLYER